MELYAIADIARECYGHGSYGDEQRICRQGGYGSGEFPPVFKTKDAAEEYRKTMEFSHRKIVVELKLID